jgi:lysine 2,3-aminomutase
MIPFPFKSERQSAFWQDWRWQLANAISDPEQLARALHFPADAAEALRKTSLRYPAMATPYYLSLAQDHSPADPILRQCLPDPAELCEERGTADPLAEEQDSSCPGLTHRYPDRALLVVNSQCAVRCRHCLRKRIWNRPGSSIGEPHLQLALDYLRQHSEIREVLVSGGDPLLLPEAMLDRLLGELRSIAHLEIIRIGSRLPVVLPQRLSPEFCQLLDRHGPIWLATHFNHPRELTPEAAQACENLVRAGIPVLNQTVLLRGVNDNPETIRQLCTGLLRIRVKPYYLFHGDPVAGTMHFRTGIAKGLEIMKALRGRTSGLAQPTFAIDLPGGNGKVPLLPDYGAAPDEQGTPCFTNYRGLTIPYADL